MSCKDGTAGFAAFFSAAHFAATSVRDSLTCLGFLAMTRFSSLARTNACFAAAAPSSSSGAAARGGAGRDKAGSGVGQETGGGCCPSSAF